jgi:hypothetical protein
MTLVAGARQPFTTIRIRMAYIRGNGSNRTGDGVRGNGSRSKGEPRVQIM